MCEIMNKLNEKAANEAAEKAAREEKIKMAVALIEDGTLSFEKIAKIAELSLEEVKALAEGQPA